MTARSTTAYNDKQQLLSSSIASIIMMFLLAVPLIMMLLLSSVFDGWGLAVVTGLDVASTDASVLQAKPLTILPGLSTHTATLVQSTFVNPLDFWLDPPRFSWNPASLLTAADLKLFVNVSVVYQFVVLATGATYVGLSNGTLRILSYFKPGTGTSRGASDLQLSIKNFGHEAHALGILHVAHGDLEARKKEVKAVEAKYLLRMRNEVPAHLRINKQYPKALMPMYSPPQACPNV